MSAVRFNRLSDLMGVEILDIDLKHPLTETQTAEIRDLFDRYQVLIFRDQHFSIADQVRAVEMFGSPAVSEYGDDRAESYFTENLFVEGLPFHQDFEFSPWPMKVLSLYAIDVDIPTVPTIWASCTRPVERMDSGERARLSGLKAVHSMDKQANKAEPLAEGATDAEADVSLSQSILRMREAVIHPQTSYPVIHTHYRTGAPLLYVTEGYTTRVEGMAEADSEALLADLFGRLYAKDNLFTHDWRKWDFAVWDNQAVQHGRPPLVPGAKRTFRRVLAADRNPKETMGELFMRPPMPAYD